MVHTTELLESPLDEERHTFVKRFKRIYVGALNDYDLVISKMFRGAEVDEEDCLWLIRARGRAFDLKAFTTRYRKTASYDVSEKRVLDNLDRLLERVREARDA